MDNKLILIGLAMFFLITRLSVMAFSEGLIDPEEESYVATITEGISEGWAMPLSDVQLDRHPRGYGCVVNSLLLLPFFLLFGPINLSIKLASLSVHTLGLIAFFYFLWKYFNSRVAILASVFYIFSPPLFTAYSLKFTGAHSESAILSVLIMFLFFDLIYGNRSGIKYCLLGFSSGLSLFYFYSNLITIITYTIIWFARERKFFLNRNYLLYSISFLAGFSPWIIFNVKSNYIGVKFINWFIAWLLNINPHIIFDKFFNLIFSYAYKIFLFDEFSLFGGNALNVIYYIIFLVAFFAIFVSVVKNIFVQRLSLGYQGRRHNNDNPAQNKNLKELAIITFPVVFFILYMLSNFRFIEGTGQSGIVNYRYAAIIFPFIFVIIAMFVDRMYCSEKNPLRALGIVLTGILLTMGVFGNAKFLYSKTYSKYLCSTAYDYSIAGMVAFNRCGFETNKVKDFIGKIKKDDSQKIKAYAGYAEAAATESGVADGLNNYITLSSAFPEERNKKWFFYGVGKGIINNFYDTRFPETEYLEHIFRESDAVNIEEVFRNYLFLGMIFNLIESREYELNIFIFSKENIWLLKDRYRNLAYMLSGIGLGRDACKRKDVSYAYEFINSIDLPYRKYCYIGVGIGCASFFSGDAKKTIAFLRRHRAGEDKFFFQGIGLYFYVNSLYKNNFEKYFPVEFIGNLDDFRAGKDVFNRLIDPSA